MLLSENIALYDDGERMGGFPVVDDCKCTVTPWPIAILSDKIDKIRSREHFVGLALENSE